VNFESRKYRDSAITLSGSDIRAAIASLQNRINSLLLFIVLSDARESNRWTLTRKGQIVSDEMDVIAHLMHC